MKNIVVNTQGLTRIMELRGAKRKAKGQYLNVSQSSQTKFLVIFNKGLLDNYSNNQGIKLKM